MSKAVKKRNDIVKNELHPKTKALMVEKEYELVPGEWYLKKYHEEYALVQIIKIDYEKKYDYHRVYYKQSTDWDTTEFELKEKDLKQLIEYYALEHLPNGIEDYKKFRDESLKVINGEISIEAYQDQQSGFVNDEHALVGRTSKATLIAVQNELEKRRDRVEMIKTFVKLEMEKRRKELEKIKEGLGLVLADFYKKIERIQRIITSIELYLGINEELHHFKQGTTASQDDPICFRQMMLYMDEEMGVWEGGGLDFNDIEFFDEWLVQKDNYKKIVPESKCVVVFRPRRKSKYYDQKEWVNAVRNMPNLNKTYILIRNGENLYRIFTENLTIPVRLFPKKKELDAILKELQDIEKRYGSDSSVVDDKKDEVEKALHVYKKQAILMQGLIDRTEVFHPMKEQISIFKLENNPGAVKFIYDDEATLPSGRKPFWDWLSDINSQITEGSRILITGEYDTYRGHWSRKDYASRFYGNRNEYSTPNLPKKGTYIVEEFGSSYQNKYRVKDWKELQKKYPDGKMETKVFKLIAHKKNHYRWALDKNDNTTAIGDKDMYLVKFTENPDLTITYQPGGEARRGWGKFDDRKNKVRFKIKSTDSWIINYDQIDLDDIEFYMNSRVDRENYLSMMPILEFMKELRLEEMKKEEQFIRFVVLRNYSQLKKHEDEIADMVCESVAWWKYKNKWKRPIDKDDTLALRMIEKRILSKKYSSFKKFSK